MNLIKRMSVALLCGAVFLAWNKPASAQTATVDLNSQKQSIRGFGGMNHPLWAGDLSAEQRATAFGNGPGQLGMTVLRSFVSDNKNDWPKEVATAKRAIELGAIVFATPWNPPAAMTHMVNGQKQIDPAQFSAYAAHLNDFVAFMKTNGVSLYAIAVQNEPDYAKDWTKWTPSEVHDFILSYGATIQTKLISAESFNYNKGYYDPLLNDSKALANVQILGTHLYGTAVGAFPYPLFDQKGAGKERWMTEHYTDSNNDADLWPMALDVAYELHNAMVEAQFNAYTWWYIRRKYSPMKENGQLSKRGYCFAHFSKFVRPGWTRVDATKSPMTDVYVSAFKSATDVSIVIVNRSASAKSLTVVIPSTANAAYERFTTSSAKSLADDGAVKTSANGSLSIALDGQSVVTLNAVFVLKDSGGTGVGGSGASSGGAASGGSAGDSLVGAAGQSGGAPNDSAHGGSAGSTSLDAAGASHVGGALGSGQGGNSASGAAGREGESSIAPADSEGCACRVAPAPRPGPVQLFAAIGALSLAFNRRGRARSRQNAASRASAS